MSESTQGPITKGEQEDENAQNAHLVDGELHSYLLGDDFNFDGFVCKPTDVVFIRPKGEWNQAKIRGFLGMVEKSVPHLRGVQLFVLPPDVDFCVMRSDITRVSCRICSGSGLSGDLPPGMKTKTPGAKGLACLRCSGRGFHLIKHVPVENGQGGDSRQSGNKVSDMPVRSNGDEKGSHRAD